MPLANCSATGARRRLSQLDLAGEAEISTRHLSFVESGRASPSREMLMRLAEPLALPLRERNRLLLAGGYAPLHGERTLDQTEMAAVKSAVEAVLDGHAPFTALAIDRHWNLIAANDGVTALLLGVIPTSAATRERITPQPGAWRAGSADTQPRRVASSPSQSPARGSKPIGRCGVGGIARRTSRASLECKSNTPRRRQCRRRSPDARRSHDWHDAVVPLDNDSVRHRDRRAPRRTDA